MGIVCGLDNAGVLDVVGLCLTEHHAVFAALGKLRSVHVQVIGSGDLIGILIIRGSHGGLAPADAFDVIVLESAAFDDLIYYIRPCAVGNLILVLTHAANIGLFVLQHNGDGHVALAFSFDGAGAENRTGLFHAASLLLVHSQVQGGGIQRPVIDTEGAEGRICQNHAALGDGKKVLFPVPVKVHDIGGHQVALPCAVGFLQIGVILLLRADQECGSRAFPGLIFCRLFCLFSLFFGFFFLFFVLIRFSGFP